MKHTKEQAKAKMQRFVDYQNNLIIWNDEGDPDIIIYDNLTEDHPFGWVFYWQVKNIKGNNLTFTKQLEKLVAELEAYQLRNPSNVIDEVVLVGEKNALLKKLLKRVSSPQENLAFIVEEIAKK